MPPMGSPVIILPLMLIQYVFSPIIDLSNYLGGLNTLALLSLSIYAAVHYDMKLKALGAYCLTYAVWYVLRVN